MDNTVNVDEEIITCSICEAVIPDDAEVHAEVIDNIVSNVRCEDCVWHAEMRGGRCLCNAELPDFDHGEPLNIWQRMAPGYG